MRVDRIRVRFDRRLSDDDLRTELAEDVAELLVLGEQSIGIRSRSPGELRPLRERARIGRADEHPSQACHHRLTAEELSRHLVHRHRSVLSMIRVRERHDQ